jgi:hypothetical protein
MSKIRSVDNSYGSDGKSKHFVTINNPDGSTSQVEVPQETAENFKKQLKEGGNGRRLLTETDPYSA